MKIAVSIPDDLFVNADRLAQQLGTSRSRLYAEAIRAYLAAHDPDAITQALNAICDELGSAIDPAVAAAAAGILERTEW